MGKMLILKFKKIAINTGGNKFKSLYYAEKHANMFVWLQGFKKCIVCFESDLKLLENKLLGKGKGHVAVISRHSNSKRWRLYFRKVFRLVTVENWKVYENHVIKNEDEM